MHPNVTDLSEQQHQAIELLMLGQSPSNIAERLGISRQTLWRWRQLPAFVQVLSEHQRQRRELMREQMVEIVNLSLVALKRELSQATKENRANPIATALAVMKLSSGALVEPPSREVAPVEID